MASLSLAVKAVLVVVVVAEVQIAAVVEGSVLAC